MGACEPRIIRERRNRDNNRGLRHAAIACPDQSPIIELGHGTHVGLRRTRNEDTYHADASLGLFLVADGMGGHQHGEVASALVRDAMVERVGAGSGLVEAVNEAGERLLARTRPSFDLLPMGTTIAALRISGDDYEVAWVGDSRIYLWQRSLRRVSHDHSLVQALLRPASSIRRERRSIRSATCSPRRSASPPLSNCASAWPGARSNRA
ncbi:hypothetical protein RLIN73S_03696 [Rhodanobacter lindaniclasticus]